MRRVGINEGGRVVLGLSFDFHDAAAALLVDGEIVAAAEEERFTRVKHDATLPEHATAACLEIGGLSADEVDHVVFYEKPLVAASRFLASKQRLGLRSFRSFMRDGPTVFGTNVMVGYRVATMLQRLGARRPPRLQYVEHHMSHAAAAFLPSPFTHAAILTVDGIGEWATATVGVGTHHRVSLLEEMRYPDSLGLVYSFVTSYCGFRSNDDEYKVMGLAPYGSPRFADEIRTLVRGRGDGSVEVDARALRWYSPSSLHRRRFASTFDGPPRGPDDPITAREADLAASVQLVLEETMLDMARHARELTGESNLCLAGGVALNCVANGRVLREGPFDQLWVQPAAGDAGSAIGAALAYWHLELGHGRTVKGGDAMHGAFLGPDVGDAAEVATRLGLDHVTMPDGALVDLVARRLAAGDVVGWCRGRMEFGPRALGHRSILADPRSPTVRQRLNELTKGRESFRPFAPAVLAERAAEWFELDHDSPYMLIVSQVRDEHMMPLDGDEPADLVERATVARSAIPACTHVDGSARIQTVADETNPQLARLLRAFDAVTGCPVLVNTSFNRAGEPIVATAADAIASATAAQLDLLVVGDVVVEGAELQRAAAEIRPVESQPVHA